MKKFTKFNFKEFLLILFVVLFAAIGGGLIFFSRFEYRFLGVGFLLISFGLEYFLLTRIDTRKDVKKSKEEIEKLLKEAREIKKEVDKSHKNIDEINKGVFDVFSKNSFKNVEQRIKALEDALEGKSSSFEFREFKKAIEDIKKIKDKLGIRF